jgi:hypothetical protein
MFARGRGQSPYNVQDLTQGFFLHLLGQGALAGVDRLKGRKVRLLCKHGESQYGARRAAYTSRNS